MAQRFVPWRQKDMTLLIRIWHEAAVKAKSRLSAKQKRAAKGDQARIERAMRLLRKGAISRAGKALERKGLGDL